jgi:hypothetical protein
MTTIPSKYRLQVLWVFTTLVSISFPINYAISQTARLMFPSKSVKSDSLRTLSLDYDKPITYGLGSKTSGLTADFKSASDGSIFIELVGVDGPTQGFHIYALKPSGDVVRFSEPNVEGLRNFSIPAAYFVTGTRAYVLRQAQVFDPSSQLKSIASIHVVVVYDDKGVVLNVIRLDPDLNPVSIAAFGSGESGDCFRRPAQSTSAPPEARRRWKAAGRVAVI